ncbi:transposon Tf2-6 polyprotein [Trichonephila clavipes]|nr:transposon Tf2-6 polyprotein [Trichonephila clavipes]
MVEKAVGISKSIMKKAREDRRDYLVGLMEYRNTPISGLDLSPAQMMFNRRLKTKLPISNKLLNADLITFEKNGTVNSVVVSGDGTWKTRGHTSLIGVCTLNGADCGKVLDMKIMSFYSKGYDSYKGPKFGPKYSAFSSKHLTFCKKNHSGSAGGMEACGMQNLFLDQNKTMD